MAGTIVSDTIQNGAGASTSTTNVINGCAKARVAFTGISGVTILGSYNVTSVTYVSTGSYRINFTNAFSGLVYATVISMQPTVSNAGDSSFAVSPSTTSVQLDHWEAGTKRDSSYTNAAIFSN